MSEPAKTPAPRRAWTKPELKKLGTIADVAGGGFGGPQGQNRT
jgi:hypothetical protein